MEVVDDGGGFVVVVVGGSVVVVVLGASGDVGVVVGSTADGTGAAGK